MNEAAKFFSELGTKYFSAYMKSLKNVLSKSNFNIVFEMYVGRMFLYSFLALVASFISSFILFSIFFPMLVAGIFAFSISIVAFVISLVSFYFYPFHLMTIKRKNIESNLPFAINHMSAVAASGAPPYVMFEILSNTPEYKELSNESKRIVRNSKTFGMDISSSIRSVMKRTPSPEFRRFLSGFISTIETGGDLKKYLSNNAQKALFDYRINREKYMKSLSTYADFYTAVLIAAPLFFISILSVMSLLGGEIFGLSIPITMRIGVYILIPMLNVIFIIFLQFTQPSA